MSVSRRTIDRWVVARREEGFEALVPSPRQCPPRLGTETEELAAGLKMENPARTAAQVRRILAAQGGAVPSLRTIQRWLEARELTTRPGGQPPEAFGRFQDDAVNEIWTADFMNGPDVGGKPSFLAGIIDDRSRLLTGPGSSAAPTPSGSPACPRRDRRPRHPVQFVLWTTGRPLSTRRWSGPARCSAAATARTRTRGRSSGERRDPAR